MAQSRDSGKGSLFSLLVKIIKSHFLNPNKQIEMSSSEACFFFVVVVLEAEIQLRREGDTINSAARTRLHWWHFSIMCCPMCKVQLFSKHSVLIRTVSRRRRTVGFCRDVPNHYHSWDIPEGWGGRNERKSREAAENRSPAAAPTINNRPTERRTNARDGKPDIKEEFPHSDVSPLT